MLQEVCEICQWSVEQEGEGEDGRKKWTPKLIKQVDFTESVDSICSADTQYMKISPNLKNGRLISLCDNVPFILEYLPDDQNISSSSSSSSSMLIIIMLIIIMPFSSLIHMCTCIGVPKMNLEP